MTGGDLQTVVVLGGFLVLTVIGAAIQRLLPPTGSEKAIAQVLGDLVALARETREAQDRAARLLEEDSRKTAEVHALVERAERGTARLVEQHAQSDPDGYPVWHVRPDLREAVKALGPALEALTRAVERFDQHQVRIVDAQERTAAALVKLDHIHADVTELRVASAGGKAKDLTRA